MLGACQTRGPRANLRKFLDSFENRPSAREGRPAAAVPIPNRGRSDSEPPTMDPPMTIQEPATLLTDYALSGLAAYCCANLFGGAEKANPRRLWAWGFGALSLGALLGGTSHGFAALLSAPALESLWRGTLAASHLANFFLAAAAARGPLEGNSLQTFRLGLGAKLLAFAAWSAFSQNFAAVIADSALSVLLIAALEILRLKRNPGDRPAKLILAGAALSAAAALVQALRISPAPWFNHNDLYHLVQAAGIVFFYRGARETSA